MPSLLVQMMDAAVDATWRKGHISFEVCRALWVLIPVSSSVSYSDISVIVCRLRTT